MSFFECCKDVQLVDGCILRALARDLNGEWRESEIYLTQYIGNNDGWFMWDGGASYSKSAKNIKLEGTYLTAELPKFNGEYRDRDRIDLNDRIGNDNGELVFVE